MPNLDDQRAAQRQRALIQATQMREWIPRNQFVKAGGTGRWQRGARKWQVDHDGWLHVVVPGGGGAPVAQADNEGKVFLHRAVDHRILRLIETDYQEIRIKLGLEAEDQAFRDQALIELNEPPPGQSKGSSLGY